MLKHITCEYHDHLHVLLLLLLLLFALMLYALDRYHGLTQWHEREKLMSISGQNQPTRQTEFTNTGEFKLSILKQK